MRRRHRHRQYILNQIFFLFRIKSYLESTCMHMHALIIIIISTVPTI